jgi:arabinogalactan endo-1,4-beta-galactosidase
VRLFNATTLLAIAALLAVAASAPAQFLRGADISFIEQYEAAGFAFREGGQPRDLIDIMAGNGINSIRLRAWHTPAGGLNSTAETVATAVRVKQRGLHFLLDLHYSDWWADPGQQTKPAAWQGQDFTTLKASVREYTRDIVAQLDVAGARPDMIQLGNEITPGMLWNDGRVGGAFETTAQWNRLGELLAAAKAGVQDALPPGESIEIMIHIDRGGDNAACRWYYNRLLATGFDFDVIGLSYYPFWHGTLQDVDENIDDLATRYGKDIVIVETAYPWTLGWADGTHNFVGQSSQLLPGYPASVQGQHDFLADLITIVQDAPNGKGRGFYYWAPEYIAIPSVPTPYENLALFDFDGNVLSSIEAFAAPPAPTAFIFR